MQILMSQPIIHPPTTTDKETGCLFIDNSPKISSYETNSGRISKKKERKDMCQMPGLVRTYDSE
jgi:hypothetical protein